MSLNALVIQQRRQTFEVLKDMNFKVLQAGDCLEGIRQIIRYSPDIVIAKVDSPVLNGVSMVQILETLEMDVPVVFTASTQRHKERSLKYSSVTGYLSTADIPKALNPLINQSLEQGVKERSHRQFQFRQNEWSDLLGISERKKILIVEDSEVFRRTALSILDPLDQFELYSARDGMEGLLKAMLIKPDLIISDIEMPVLNGFIMSQIFFILNKPFPIVFLTAQDSEEYRKKAQIIESVIGFMSKSILRENDQFISEIYSFLRVSEGMKNKIVDKFTNGSVNDLDKTGQNLGILQAGLDFRPQTHHQVDFQTRHRQGLGGLFK